MTKILIADDDEDFTAILGDRLKANGYEILFAHEGVGVVEIALKEKPHLIILDWKMPFGKGSAVLEMLAEKDETRKIPVIILSGNDEPGMRKTALSMGACQFIRKPYDPKKLIETIRDVLA